MSANRVALVAVLLLLAILGALSAYWFEHNFERVEETVRGDLSAQARRNPWLAAERLLEGLGIRAESRSGRRYLTEPPMERGVLFVRDLGAPLPKARQEALLDWVGGGGHLVLSPGVAGERESGHSLLARFGVELRHPGRLVPIVPEETDEGDKGTLISLPESEEELAIDFDTTRWFSVDSDYDHWEAPGDDRPNLLIFSWGEGRITFLSDDGFWNNTRIGEQDHALLLARLAGGYERAWLLYSAQMPSLAGLIWRKAPYLVSGLTLLLALLLWWMGQRTGPRLYRSDYRRRDLLEHLQAAAEFAWRTDHSSGMLENVRRQVERRWLGSHPLLQRLEQGERCRWLAERTGMTARAIEAALYGDPAEGGQVISNSKILQRLLSALHPQSGKR